MYPRPVCVPDPDGMLIISMKVIYVIISVTVLFSGA